VFQWIEGPQKTSGVFPCQLLAAGKTGVQRPPTPGSFQPSSRHLKTFPTGASRPAAKEGGGFAYGYSAAPPGWSAMHGWWQRVSGATSPQQRFCTRV